MLEILFFLFSHILEILEIEVFNILHNPGNTGNLILISHILQILEIEVCNILYSLEIWAAGGRWRAGGSRGCVVLPWIIFETCSWENEHGNLGIKVKTSTFFKMAP